MNDLSEYHKGHSQGFDRGHEAGLAKGRSDREQSERSHERKDKRIETLETDFRRALSIVNDYYWAPSRKAGQKADTTAREFLTEMNAKYAVLLSTSQSTSGAERG